MTEWISEQFRGIMSLLSLIAADQSSQTHSHLVAIYGFLGLSRVVLLRRFWESFTLRAKSIQSSQLPRLISDSILFLVPPWLMVCMDAFGLQ